MVLLPKILVSAISLSLLNAAIKFTINSGADVPNATTVKPMTKSGTFNRLAKPDAPLTNQSAPKINTTKPTINKPKDNTIILNFFQ